MLPVAAFDGFFEHALHAWDVAAGVLILNRQAAKYPILMEAKTGCMAVKW
jgi:fructose-1,6-bisphosphatase/inositol monophosphatase family enzyme